MPWWKRFSLRPGAPWRLVAYVDDADEIPEHLPFGGAVLVGRGRTRKWLAFDCPCGVGDRILLNLEPSRTPSWRVSVLGGLTVRPSVVVRHRTGRCHYLLEHGRVVWVNHWEATRGRP